MRIAQTTFPGEPCFLLALVYPAVGMGTGNQGQSPWLQIREGRSMLPASPPDRPPSRLSPFLMPEESTQPAKDQRLLAAVAQGETGAFAALYDRLSGPLYALCLRMTGEAQEAEDILQEVCVTIWKRAASYDPERSSVFSWAVHLTRCKAIDHLRSRGRRLRVVVPAVGYGDGDGLGGRWPWQPVRCVSGRCFQRVRDPGPPRTGRARAPRARCPACRNRAR